MAFIDLIGTSSSGGTKQSKPVPPPPLRIYVYSTHIKFKIPPDGILPGTSISLVPFINRNLMETEWNQRFKFYQITARYSAYDKTTGQAMLPRYALERLKDFIGNYVPIEEIPVEPVQPHIVRMSMKRKFEPREAQVPVIEFLSREDHGFKPVSLACAAGKTVCAITSAINLKHPFLIVLFGLIPQWTHSIKTFTNLTSHEIYLIKGIAPLQKLWEMGREGYRPKCIIFSTRTLDQYIEKKPGYSELPSYEEFCIFFGIGTKIIDEVHLSFATNVSIDLHSNIKHNIYLSATYQRSNFQGQRIFYMIYPPKLIYGFNSKPDNKYTLTFAVEYKLGIFAQEVVKFKVPKGYSHAKYESYLLEKRDRLFNVFMDKVILPLLQMYYRNVKKDKQKCLILCSTRAFAEAIYDYLNERCEESVTLYFSGDSSWGAQSNFDKEIIVSTNSSCGVGRDIKLLKTCINTISFSSAPLAKQVMGRLRKLPDEDTIFLDLWNSEVPAHKKHINDRVSSYRLVSKLHRSFRIF